MAEDRKPYRRESEAKRRRALIAATLSLVSEGGARAATVRAIADRAGVTAGLIRHYFQTKEALIAAAFLDLMTTMTEDNMAALNLAPSDPHARLVAFVDAALRPPVADRDSVVRWASFVQEASRNPVMLEIHRTTYEDYRNHLRDLIAALPTKRDDAELRQLAIACNALIDGLWLAVGTLPQTFARGELVRVAVRAIGAILGLDLQRYLLLSGPPNL